jgi:hypothetical protein
MLEDIPDLTLDALNDATQAWLEHEYNRKVHSETAETPIARFLAGPEVTRSSPDSAALRLAFTKSDERTQRKSDGTIVIEGHRFEVPSRYRHLDHVTVRYASYDLTLVHLLDGHTGVLLCRLYPLDRSANASGQRRQVEPIAAGPVAAAPAKAIPPLLAELLAKQAATGLPPAYLPKDEGDPP